MDKVLVTGGLGFLGSHLIKALPNTEIHIIDKGDDERIQNMENKPFVNKISLLDSNLENIVKEINPDTVFHLGAFTLPFRNKEFMQTSLDSNIKGTVNLLAALEDVDVKSFIYTSSSEVYGSKNKAPFREDMIPRPTSPYSVSKLAGEYYTLLYNDTYGFPGTILRLFNIYGPWQTPNRIIPELIKKTLEGKTFKTTKGEQTREFNYVKDIVSALIKTAETPSAVGETINIGCAQGIAIKDIIKIITEKMNSGITIENDLPYRKNEIWEMHSDNSKAKEILNWEPEYNIEKGLQETIDWYSGQWKTNKDSIAFRGE
jgi:UDP-glucose 4-epimerase